MKYIYLKTKLELYTYGIFAARHLTCDNAGMEPSQTIRKMKPPPLTRQTWNHSWYQHVETQGEETV